MARQRPTRLDSKPAMPVAMKKLTDGSAEQMNVFCGVLSPHLGRDRHRP